ncbi:DUF2637 domain-containing protein [Kribbella sp. VKM Ac-2566]|uniref:DUF2637 domain-containing protein n=1 Tax=Kribbella sp. VKM Ac-2566 TaxID=2512218 RepID=UPI001062C001|nr:DUF2637 domain-containing protein [Kribbella sp. VKM Ac-2566]TDW91107.1 uncharacterized protein DUF2637 [Kribbella sp. VKM Ac-2566]
MITLSINLPDRLDHLGALTWPMIAAGAAGLILLAAVVTGLIWSVRRAVRGMTAAIEAGRLTTRRVLIVVAVIAALAVAGIGGARSFGAVSHKFDSPLVPLVADGMIVACTALRLAALTRGWRIPGALVTTYVFIGGTVWLNIDTAHGIADAVAHALAPLAYAVLVEMLAHLLRLHLRLAQPAKPRLSALTWITSPVITTRVWLHLSRTGSDDPIAARALVQQVVRMASRLATLCPSRKLWPLDAARAARTAALQTIRDGLLSASELALLLPAGGRLTPGELLALVDSAALGLTDPSRPDESEGPADVPSSAERIEPRAAPVWLLTYLLGALRTASATAMAAAPVHPPVRTAPTAPVHDAAPSGAPAPMHAPHRTEPATHQPTETGEAAPRKTAGPSDAELLDAVVRHAAEQGGTPLGQREIRRATEEAFGRPVGFGRAKRLQELAGWAEPAADSGDDGSPAPQVRGQLQLVNDDGENTLDNNSDDTTASRELESSSSR